MRRRCEPNVRRWTLSTYDEYDIDEQLKHELDEELRKILQKTESVTKRKTIKKLSELYGGPLLLPERKDGFINLSSVELTEKQAELLNLGLNCHVQSPYDIAVKKREIELLYQSIEKQEKSGKVTVNPNLKERLLGESTIKRSHERGKVLTKAHREAAAELRNNPNIVIRRADKSNVYVILDRDEYLQKNGQNTVR